MIDPEDLQRLRRRTLLKTIGLSAGGMFLPSLMGDRHAYAAGLPKRVVFLLPSHGPVTQRWPMQPPGISHDNESEASLSGLSVGDFSKTLQPLHSVRDKVLILDGLAMTSVMAEPGCSANGHGAAIANRLAAAGGGPNRGSVDRLIANHIMAPGQIHETFAGGSCGCWSGGPTFDTDGKPVSWTRYVDFGNLEGTVKRMFANVQTNNGPPPPPTPRNYSLSRREQTLAFVRGRYDAVQNRLSKEDRDKVARHADFVNDLSIRMKRNPQQGAGCFKPVAPPRGNTRTEAWDFMLERIIPAAFACDVTRAITLGYRQWNASDLGAPSTLDVHQEIAHGSQSGDRADWMENYYALHMDQFKRLLEALDAIPEGNGTLLDNTIVVMAAECANGNHDFNRWMGLIGGGSALGLRTGRYIRYPEQTKSPSKCRETIGPAHSKMYVSIMQAFGMTDNAIGLQTAYDEDGKPIDLTGPLSRLT